MQRRIRTAPISVERHESRLLQSYMIIREKSHKRKNEPSLTHKTIFCIYYSSAVLKKPKIENNIKSNVIVPNDIDHAKVQEILVRLMSLQNSK